MKKLIILLIGISLSLSLSAQHRVVYGRVNMFENLQLRNILVTAKKTGTQTRTDSLGNFAIVCKEKDVLEFSGKTFNTERIKIRPTDDSVFVNMRFLDNPENVELAIGYGYITKDKATHAFTGLTSQHEDFCIYSDIFELINGRCAGVKVERQNNFPGEEQEILIRGKYSINTSNCALYVVDGVVVSQIAGISPCDVKSISFLKDASASIYGSRGAGGVVLIETRKGI